MLRGPRGPLYPSALLRSQRTIRRPVRRSLHGLFRRWDSSWVKRSSIAARHFGRNSCNTVTSRQTRFAASRSPSNAGTISSAFCASTSCEGACGTRASASEWRAPQFGHPKVEITGYRRSEIRSPPMSKNSGSQFMPGRLLSKDAGQLQGSPWPRLSRNHRALRKFFGAFLPRPMPRISRKRCTYGCCGSATRCSSRRTGHVRELQTTQKAKGDKTMIVGNEGRRHFKRNAESPGQALSFSWRAK